MFIMDNKPLPLDVPFTHNGVNYPANWLRLASPEERSAAGVSWAPDPVRPDDRFYWVDDNNHGTPKSLDILKPQWSAQCDQTAYTMLLTSDWMVVRKAETGAEIPADWQSYRSAIRTACTDNKALLNAAVDFDAFVSVATTLAWPVSPDITQ